MPEFRKYPHSNARTIVNFDALLAKVQSNDEVLLCLNVGLVDLIRKLLVERGLWRTTYAIEQGEIGYSIPTESEFNPVKQAILEFLEVDMSSCLDAFTALSEAIRYLGDRIYDKPCCSVSGGTTAIVQGVTESGQPVYGSTTPYPTIDEGVGDPPEGFETWEEYLTNKCAVANFVVDKLINNIRFLGSVSLANLTALAGLLGVSLGVVAVFPPSAIPIVVGALVVLGASVGTLVTVANWLQDVRGELVCDIYIADSATAAISAWQAKVQAALTDLGVSAVLQPLIIDVALALANTDQINTLFDGSVRISYPGADCSNCGQNPCVFSLEYGDLYEGDNLNATSFRVGAETAGAARRVDMVLSEGATNCVGQYSIEVIDGSLTSLGSPKIWRVYDCSGQTYDSDTQPSNPVVARAISVNSTTDFAIRIYDIDRGENCP